MANRTILILGNEYDEHARHMLAELKNRECDVELLDSRWFPGQMTIALDPIADKGQLRLPAGRTLRFADVAAVYWRNYDGAEVPQLPDPEQEWIAQNDARGLFESFLMRLSARWVNGWNAFRLHQTKPVQLARVAALGIRVPQTVLTNEPAIVKEFYQRHERAIVKPVQGGDHAARLEAELLSVANLGNLQIAPITVQEEVLGTNIRVFVAGERVLACEVRTDAIDFRDDQAAKLIVHSLPAETQHAARRICQDLDLVWSGIDFRLTPAGEYVFLEANPSPMFLGFERQTGLPLTESLAALLMGEAGP